MCTGDSHSNIHLDLCPSQSIQVPFILNMWCQKVVKKMRWFSKLVTLRKEAHPD